MNPKVDKLNHTNVETGLTDAWWYTREQWAKRTDFIPTYEQVERGLTDSEWSVRCRWAQRADYTPTQIQIERGLNDKVEAVQSAWKTRLCSDMEMILVDDNYTMSSI
jgi:hypothetical protein